MFTATVISYAQLYRVLGLEPPPEAFPGRLQCPLCHAPDAFFLYDTDADGQKHHCFACGRSGDPVELAAAVWQVPVAAALEKLHERGFEPLPVGSADWYLRWVNQRQPVLREFWQRAEANFYRNPDEVNSLRGVLGLSCPVPPERLRPVLSGVLGVSSSVEAQHGVCPNAVKDGPGNYPSSTRLFRGSGWRSVLVIPYWSDPGSITALWFCGRRGGPADRVFRVVQRSNGMPADCPEAGLVGLPNLESAKLDSGRHVVALSDPMMLARLQMRHARTASRPLPLVAWLDDGRNRTRAAWQSLQDRRPVFWAWELTPAVLAQAIATEGRISTNGPREQTHDAVGHYLRLWEPRDLLRMVVSSAIPWREAARRWARDSHPAAVEEFLLRSQAYGTAGELAAALGQPIPSPAEQAPRQAFVAGRRVLERGGQWLLPAVKNVARLPPRVFCSVILRIDQQVKRGGRVYYRGRILADQQTHPFEVDSEVIEESPAAWLRRTCLNLGLPRPTLFGGPKTAGYSLLDVAYAFQPPAILEEP